MPIRNQPFKPGDYYHVINRHFREKRIIITFQDTLKLEQILWDRCKKYNTILKAYAIMDTHFHLLIELNTNSNIPKLMMSLQRSYSQYFNHKYHRKGQLFTHNYFAKRATTLSYIKTIRQYISDNPTKKVHRQMIDNMLSVNL